MPRLGPRQRLIRDVVLVVIIGIAGLAASGWWALTPIDKPMELAIPSASTGVASAPPLATAPTGASLWQPIGSTVMAAVTEQPAQDPRLISLSHRDGRWTALIDPGDGVGSRRVSDGDSINNWRIEKVDGDGVSLGDGTRHLQLTLKP